MEPKNPLAIKFGFGHKVPTPATPDGCGCSSGVEHNLAKVRVERSNRFTRSNFPVTHRMFKKGRDFRGPFAFTASIIETPYPLSQEIPIVPSPADHCIPAPFQTGFSQADAEAVDAAPSACIGPKHAP
jgi:hypothetical protein